MADTTPIIDLVYRRLDSNGDMVLGAGEYTALKNLDAITQAIHTRLRHLKGEWWENRKDGLPLYQQILGQPRTEDQRQIVDLLIIERINDTRGVKRVRNPDSFYSNDRTYTFSCECDTEYGIARIEVNSDGLLPAIH
ncbi:hypothetical protein FACS1894184_14220 [Clostridia bacterium]|nr:hypothetical protein FACS1894184_14220 [Clostridia bacterium]